MKVLILGAGVTGLSLGQLLRDKFDVTILEKESRVGGIAKTRKVDGVTYHPIGGHCFNSKYDEIMSFVFGLLPKDEWHCTKRLSRINLGSYEVDYPIEFSIKQIFEKDEELAFEITRDFLSSSDNGRYSDLENWFRQKFGDKLCELYFLPYNTKIWGCEPKLMNYEWVKDKLPIPDKKSFFASLMDSQTDSMPHSSFYYPNSNDQGSLIETLAKGLSIQCDEEVKMIKRENDEWVVNGVYRANLLISTIPLNLLPLYIEGVPDHVIRSSKKLKYNRISNVLWESKPTDKTWTYQPLKESIFHRYIHIGSFFQPTKNYTITESMGEKTYDEMVECGSKDSFLIKPLDYNISDHAYVVFDENRNEAVKQIQTYLDKIGLISIGRFGQWEYFNMDVCMKQSYDTYLKLVKQL